MVLTIYLIQVLLHKIFYPIAHILVKMKKKKVTRVLAIFMLVEHYTEEAFAVVFFKVYIKC